MAENRTIAQSADPARIARLKHASRLTEIDPQLIWDKLPQPESGTIIDVGTGVGYLALPMAKRLPNARIIAADILPGMLEVLSRDIESAGLENIEPLLMEPTRAPLPDATADVVTMLQLHHELTDPSELLSECHRLLRKGGAIAVIDWKPNDEHKGAAPDRLVPQSTVMDQLAAAGFAGIQSHGIFQYHFFITGQRP